jgi:predicted TPR repeat methyltransferase
VSQAVAGALLSAGYFVFTLERSEGDLPQGYQIHQHGRFSHTEAYIRNTLNAAGLTVIKLEKVMLRYEAGIPVDGFLVVACKV